MILFIDILTFTLKYFIRSVLDGFYKYDSYKFILYEYETCCYSKVNVAQISECKIDKYVIDAITSCKIKKQNRWEIKVTNV
jgi:hypothetical protein